MQFQILQLCINFYTRALPGVDAGMFRGLPWSIGINRDMPGRDSDIINMFKISGLCRGPPRWSSLPGYRVGTGICRICDIWCIRWFPPYRWCQCGILDRLECDMIYVVMTVSWILSGRRLGRPLDQASFWAHSVRDSWCVKTWKYSLTNVHVV